jgi:hypothetical protein
MGHGVSVAGPHDGRPNLSDDMAVAEFHFDFVHVYLRVFLPLSRLIWQNGL